MSVHKRIYLGRYIRPIMLLSEWLMVNLFFAIAVHIWPDRMFEPAWQLWTLVNISFVPIAIYDSRHNNTGLRAIQLDRLLLRTLAKVGFHALCFMALVALFSLGSPGIRLYITYYGMLGTAMIIWAFTCSRILKHYRRRGFNYLRVVIVGTNSTARRLHEAMIADKGYGYKVLGFFDHERHTEFNGCYCGLLSDLPQFVKDNNVDQIYYTLTGDDEELPSVVKTADDNVVDFFYVPQISRYIPLDFQISSIGTVPLLTLRHNPLRKTINRVVKRTLDIGFSSIVLLFYPLIYLPIALIIKVTSPGPVYFIQQRTGYKGKSFGCIKFRTMHVNVDADRVQATENDPRKTPFGDFLRRTNLDELPQFINVFKGDMSIVGPRPHMLKHTEEYSKIISQYMVRHFVKPGITGWAQVNGYRGLTDEVWKMERRVEHDVWYIEHWTILLDLKIIARTAFNLFHRDKNAF